MFPIIKLWTGTSLQLIIFCIDRSNFIYSSYLFGHQIETRIITFVAFSSRISFQRVQNIIATIDIINIKYIAVKNKECISTEDDDAKL